jgi:anti-anti-sigma regulatory factor
MAIPRRRIVCDVGALVSPDAATIDALARLQLTLRRLGFELRLRHVPDELAELIAFAGLSDVLGVKPGGQAEEGKQRLGVEEECELDDPSR